MTSVLFLGLLIGMRHALEADHVAAMASLATRSRGAGETLRLGMAWGAGHSATLLLVGVVVLVFDSLVPEHLARVLEIVVGMMLVVLGLDLLRRLVRERVHFHAHRHGGKRHFHAHSHADQQIHDAAAHDHEHPKTLTSRALLVGMVHGLAGSAALVLLTLGTLDSPGLGILYILLFGAGSIIGMATLSCVIALPLRFLSRSLSTLHRGLTATIGAGTVVLGAFIVYDTTLAFGF